VFALCHSSILDGENVNGNLCFYEIKRERASGSEECVMLCHRPRSLQAFSARSCQGTIAENPQCEEAWRRPLAKKAVSGFVWLSVSHMRRRAGDGGTCDPVCV